MRYVHDAGDFIWEKQCPGGRLPLNAGEQKVLGPISFLSLKFKINLIFHLIKEFTKHSCIHFFYEIVNTISIKVKRN